CVRPRRCYIFTPSSVLTCTLFFSNHSDAYDIVTLSLHDALPIYNIASVQNISLSFKSERYSEFVTKLHLPFKVSSVLIYVFFICNYPFIFYLYQYQFYSKHAFMPRKFIEVEKNP